MMASDAQVIGPLFPPTNNPYDSSKFCMRGCVCSLVCFCVYVFPIVYKHALLSPISSRLSKGMHQN